MRGVDDPFALLGLTSDASSDELTAAYRAAAKEWHPDRRPGEDASDQMARINAAYDAARAALANPQHERPAANGVPPRPRARRANVAGHWLDAATRRALGAELARSLHDGEDVLLVVPTSTWASPQARLALTDRRLLWLNEDAIGDRIRSLRYEQIARVDQRPSWPRRRTATLRVRDRQGRRLTFAELKPESAVKAVRFIREHLMTKR
jgi:curved DNA-binding protein CbpA